MAHFNVEQRNKSGDGIDVVYTIMLNDEVETPVLQFLDKNGEVIASFNKNDYRLTPYKKITIGNADDVDEGICVLDDPKIFPATGKTIVVGNKKQGKYYYLPISNDLYSTIKENLPKGKHKFNNLDYYKSMCSIAVRNLSKLDQQSSTTQTKLKNQKPVQTCSIAVRNLSKLDQQNGVQRPIQGASIQPSSSDLFKKQFNIANSSELMSKRVFNHVKRDEEKNITNDKTCHDRISCKTITTKSHKKKRPEIAGWMILVCVVLVGFIFIIRTKLKQQEYDNKYKNIQNNISYNLDNNISNQKMNSF